MGNSLYVIIPLPKFTDFFFWQGKNVFKGNFQMNMLDTGVCILDGFDILTIDNL